MQESKETKQDFSIKHIIGAVLFSLSLFFIIYLYEYIVDFITNLEIEYSHDFTIIFACYVFPITGLFAILFSQIQHYNGISKQKYILNNPGQTWRKTWLIGTICICFSYYLKHHLYYVYIYFMIVGTISFLNYIRPYAIIDKNQLTIFYGNYFFRKNIALVWDNISNISVMTKIVPVIRKAGGRIQVPVKDEVQVEYISVLLNKPELSLPDKKNVKGSILSINESKTEIILEEPPNHGFEYMTKKCYCIYDFETDLIKKSFEKEHKLNEFLYYFIFIVPFIILIFSQMLLYGS